MSEGGAGEAGAHPHRRSTQVRAAALFLLSGTGALVVETLWLRWFRLLLGATAPAVSATLVAFFAGQTLGALWGGRLARRSARPLRTYGGLELLSAVAAASVPLLLAVLQGAVDEASDALRDAPALLTSLRFATALAAAGPAGVAFGATLPPLAAWVMDEGSTLGPRAGALLAANTMGGALGVALASFVLPQRLGVRGAYALGLAALACAGCTALWWDQRATPAPIRRRASAAPAAPALPARTLAALAFTSGFGVFAGQSLLVQAFARVLNQSTQAFGLVLVVVLGALGLAAASAAALARRVEARTLLGWAALAAAVAWAGFPAVFVGATDGLAYWGSSRPWPGYLLSALGLAFATAGPPLFAAGLVLPSVWHAAGRLGESAGTSAGRAGRLLAWNTGGAVLGALAAPYVLLPGLGLWLAMAAVAVLYGVAAVAIPAAPGSSRLLRDGALAVAWLLVMTRGSPMGLPALHLEEGDRLLDLEETAAGTVAVIQRGNGLLLQIDNHYALGGTADRVHQERQGHLPLLLTPRPRRALFLGSATGSSAGSALAHPVEHLTLVELVPAVTLVAPFFREANRGVTDPGRARMVVDDARSFLRSTHETFDTIVADLFVPWRAGTGSLYTEEHFRAARDHLQEGGLFCQWLPLYQLSERETRMIARTFMEVFPNAVLFRGDFYGRFPIVALIGWKGTPPGVAEIDARIAEFAAAGEKDRWVTRPEAFWALYVGALAPAERLWREVPRNRDDRPLLELEAARSHAGSGGGKRGAFVGLRWVRFAKELREASLPAPPPFAGMGERERRAGDAGHALQTAGALFDAGDRARAGQALARAASLLPPDVLAGAPADPTVSRVWPQQEPMAGEPLPTQGR